MKPLISESADAAALQDVGRASLQIVHDLKNQLNGLKLYATFLRKRLEKSERPADELETIAKLIAGLERAATDMTALVRYGRPLELRRAPQTDLVRLLRAAADGADIDAGDGTFTGEFDATTMTEALKSITAGAHAAAATAATHGNPQATPDGSPAAGGAPPQIRLRRDDAGDAPVAVIEWHGARTNGSDPFSSFMGTMGLRMALAAKIIRAHGGEVAHEADTLTARLPVAP